MLFEKLHNWTGLKGVPLHDNPAALSWEKKLHWVMIFVALLSIPAIYLEFFSADLLLRPLGWGLNFFIFAAFFLEMLWMVKVSSYKMLYLSRNWLNVLITLSAATSLFGWEGEWMALVRLLRVAFVALLFIRVLRSLRTLSPTNTPYLIFLGIIVIGIAGAGFLWLEPTVHTYADGLWLAFTSGATVGYGDIVPTTHASRFFAVIMVLVGYALLSLVTASIAAFFVGEDEKLLKREIHREMKALRAEIAQLREDLNKRK